MNEFKVFEKQSWFDVAIYLFGDASKAFDLAFQNNSSITSNLNSNQNIKIIELEKNKLVINSLISNQCIPATALMKEIHSNVPSGLGIGSMKIGSTFKIK